MITASPPAVALSVSVQPLDEPQAPPPQTFCQGRNIETTSRDPATTAAASATGNKEVRRPRPVASASTTSPTEQPSCSHASYGQWTCTPR